MSKRIRVVTAVALAIIGAAILATTFAGPLHASGVNEAVGFDLSKLFLWGGAGIVILSAVIFLSVSGD